MGSPVWELGKIICVGNIFKNKVQLVFMNEAFPDDPHKIFNVGLEGNQQRVIDVFEGDTVDEDSLQALVRSAITYNRSKMKQDV